MASCNYTTKKVTDCFEALDAYFCDSFNDDDQIAAILTLVIEGKETWEMQFNSYLKDVREDLKEYKRFERVYNADGMLLSETEII